jgi:hypothetical protein
MARIPDNEHERPDSMNSRRLTVSSLHPECRAARPRYLPSAPMPFLRLQGRWLDQAGFAIGANVRVEVTAGRLVVELMESDPKQDQL